MPLAAALAVVGAVVAGALLRPFLFVEGESPLPNGPVVALGGSPARVEVAVRIVEGSERERALLLSHPPRAEATPDGRCAEPGVRCIWPQPVSTWGEAQAIARLADEEGWSGVTIVTDDFHVPRSRSLFRRCLDVPVRLVGTGGGTRVPVTRATHEAAATFISALVHRAC
jgi:hypothetical protein